MKIWITGVSQGLGKALAENALNQGHFVIGMGRRSTVVHKNFSFLPCDFSDTNEVKKITFSASKDQKVVLINNAGIIGNIDRISSQKNSDIEEVMTVNSITPMLLTAKFLQTFPKDQPKMIVNISSGAGKRPIPSWAAYCSSKAALNLFSETIFLEEKEKESICEIVSISPGVINTNMQEKIRIAPEQGFSSSKMFRDLSKNGELLSPEEVANKILKLIHQGSGNKVLWTLNEIQD